MLSGAVGGYQSGGKGKNVADFFRNQSANAQANRDRAARINAAGGGLAYARGRAEGALGITAAQNAKAARYEREQKHMKQLMQLESLKLKIKKVKMDLHTVKVLMIM